jgi:hypothetical protein
VARIEGEANDTSVMQDSAESPMFNRRTFFGLTLAYVAVCDRAQASSVVTILSPERYETQRVVDVAHSVSTPYLSVIAAPGYGPVQNVKSLLARDAAQIAVLQADVLEFLKHRKMLPESSGLLRYIAQLYSAQVHVLAQQRISSITELAGQQVGIGSDNSVSYITSTQLFDMLGLAVQPVIVEHADALQRLRRRELAAVVYVGGAPDRSFLDFNRSQDGVHFLPLSLTPTLSSRYLPAELNIQQYPLLIGEGEAGIGAPVPTIAVPMLLAVYNWPAGSSMHRTLSLFADEFARIAPVSLEPTGWTRFLPAIASGTLAHRAAPPAQITSEQREKLFREYEKWRAQRQREALFEDYLRWLQTRPQSP